MSENTVIQDQKTAEGSGDILSGGIEILETLKENLLELDGYRQRCRELDAEEDRLERQLSAREQSIQAEITAVTRQRRQEIESSFDSEINTIKTRMKKIRSKKDKLKTARISERIQIETAELEEQKREKRAEIRAVFRKEQINRLCGSRLFYSFFLPAGIGDLLYACIFVLVLLLIPCGIYFLLIPDRKGYMIVLMYLAVILVFGGLYALLRSKVRTRHLAAFQSVRLIRSDIFRIEKEERRIARGIRRDRDESGYGLEKYDEQLQLCQKKLDELAENEKKALKEFDSGTRTALAKEITDRNQKELDDLMARHEKAEADQDLAEQKAREFAVEITRRYEGFMGKDMMNLQAVDALSELIASGRASNVSEAALLYRQENQSRTAARKK